MTAVVGEQLGVIGIMGNGILQHLAVLELGAVVQHDIPILGAVIFVWQLDMLGRVETEAIHAVVHRLHEVIMHHVGGLGLRGVDVVQAEQLAVCHLVTVVVVLYVAVVAVVMVQVGLPPTIRDGIPGGGHMVGDHVHDDAHAVLVCGGAQALQIGFGTHHPVADGGVGRLVHVVPVLGEDLALITGVDGGDRLGLHGGVAGCRDFRNVLFDRLERPFPRMQRGAFAHLLRQTVLGTCGLECGVLHGIGVAVAVRGGLCRRSGDGDAADGGGYCDHAYGKLLPNGVLLVIRMDFLMRRGMPVCRRMHIFSAVWLITSSLHRPSLI